ncbi:MAG TPA: hypothetical protein VF163_10760, partial [Micromonosporaceae bacterium]
LGTAGPPPDRVEVIVVGTADQADLLAACAAAERRLGRQVTLRQLGPEAWYSWYTDPGRPTDEALVEIDLAAGRGERVRAITS